MPKVCSEMLSVKSVMNTQVLEDLLCVWCVLRSVFQVIRDVMIQVVSTGCLCMCSHMCTCLLLSERHNYVERGNAKQCLSKNKTAVLKWTYSAHTNCLFMCEFERALHEPEGVGMSLSLSCVHHQINYVLVWACLCVFVVCFPGYHVHHCSMFSMSDAMNNSFSFSDGNMHDQLIDIHE